MINKVYINNYKRFVAFTFPCNPALNIIVGDNEAGKSTLLEAIHLCLTKKLNGRSIDQELTAYLVNREVSDAYIAAVAGGGFPDLPVVEVELYFSDDQRFQTLRGKNNHNGEDAVGVRLELSFDDEYRDEYKQMLDARDENPIRAIPVEYYKSIWTAFSGNHITFRSLQALDVGISHIDTTSIRLVSGTDHYLQTIISEGLDPKQKRGLSVAYRRLREHFANEPAIKDINTQLTAKKGILSDKDIAVGIDVSHRTNWESSLTPHLDEMPLQYVGKGEQNAVKMMLALERKADTAQVVLIEEPENHLSFSSMNILIERVRARCEGKQIFATTHSAYVLNKLGIENIVLLRHGQTAFLKSLPMETQRYFRKLSGYDTLRLILAKKTILVEGPSDELLVQKAYLLKHSRLPLDAGVDVINVRGLSFTRFLDIAKELNAPVCVITDNDGDHDSNVVAKYAPYVRAGVTICASSDNTRKTLEPHLAACNTPELLGKIFGRTFADAAAAERFMTANKTECALKLFDTAESITIPEYVNRAVA